MANMRNEENKEQQHRPPLLNNNYEYPTMVPDEMHNQLDWGRPDHKRADQVSFVRKVLGIVSAQMFTTFGFAVASSYYPEVGRFCQDPIILICSCVMMIPVLCALMCSRSMRETVPINYLLLSIFTILESVSVGSLTASFDVASVLVSIGVFCLVTGSLWIAALNTRLSA